jgi:hypothetical protein
MERMKCQKDELAHENDVETVKKDVETNDGYTVQNQDTFENIKIKVKIRWTSTTPGQCNEKRAQ